MPSAAKPLLCWKALTAASVLGPKMPSTATSWFRAHRSCCSGRTGKILWPRLTSGHGRIESGMRVSSQGSLLSRMKRAARKHKSPVVDDDRCMESILEAIGNTPLVRIRGCAPPNGAELWLKLEYRNPTGSMKDRMALAMIEGAERDGLIAAGDTVVEYTG